MNKQKPLPASYEKNGIHYTLHGEYYLPDFKLPECEPYSLGKYGRMRLRFLEQHARGIYSILLTSGKLAEHLRETETAAKDAVNALVQTLAKQYGATETLKA